MNRFAYLTAAIGTVAIAVLAVACGGLLNRFTRPEGLQTSFGRTPSATGKAGAQDGSAPFAFD